MRNVSKAFLVIAGLLFIAAPAQAQSSIAGQVRDTSGGVLPGVTVEASSPALIEQTRTAVTDSQGQYNIIDLRPGTYTVVFTLTGFRVRGSRHHDFRDSDHVVFQLAGELHGVTRMRVERRQLLVRDLIKLVVGHEHELRSAAYACLRALALVRYTGLAATAGGRVRIFFVRVFAHRVADLADPCFFCGMRRRDRDQDKERCDELHVEPPGCD